MAKIDFERTPDGSQRIVDNNLKVGKALFLPDYTGGSLGINGNPDEAGAIAYKDAAVWSYDGSTWSMLGLPSGGTSPKYLRGDGTWQTLDTAAVPENTNLYYTASRFNTAFAAKTTADLTEGSNLYYTAARFNSAFAAKNTDGLTEGSTNLYYTVSRFNAAFGGKTTDDLAQGSTNKYYANSLVQTFSDARYLQLSGGTLTGDVQQATAPVNATSLINKGYVDNLITGISWKQEVRAATTANITLSGTQTIDGVALVALDRVLVKNQTSAINNGIYIVSAGSWSRSTDADSSSEIGSATVLVRNGTTLKNTQWTCTNSVDPIINTDNITFGQISGAGTYTNGTGLALSANIFSLDLTYTDARYVQPSGLTPYALIAGQAFTGAISAPSVALSGTGGVGVLSMIAQTSIPTTPAVGSQIIYADASGRFTIMGSNGFSASLSKSLLTASRIYNLPDAAGVIALQATTLAGYGITDAYPLTGNPSSFLTANQNITLSGDISGSGTTAITTAIGAGKVTNAMLAGSISNGNLANSTISGIALGSNLANLTATNASLTFSGAYNGGSAQSVGLNVANANNWTAVQNFGPTVTASAGLGVAMNITPSLNASANSDVLSSIYINSTFSAGAFTGVVQAPLKIHWSTTGVTFTDFCISNVVGDGVVTLHAAAIPTTNNYFFRCQGVDTILNAPNAAGTILLRVNNATYMQMYSTGRVGFQNGGTYTDDLIHRVQIQGGISIGGVAISAAAWGTNGVNMVSNAATYTDNSSATGTVTFNAVNSFAQPTLASTSASVIYSQAATLYVAAAPVAGTNVTISNPFAIYVAAGLSSFNGGISTNGNSTNSNFYLNSATGISISTTASALLFAGAANVSARGVFNGSGSSTLTANTSYGGTIFGSQPATAAATGTHGFIANVVVNAIGTITNTSAIPITNTASLYVGPASAAGTNNYSIYNVGVHGMAGTTSGVVSITPQAASGTYNYNLPTTAGVAGQVQASGGGGSNPMTWVSLLSKPHTIFTPTTGGTVTLINNQYNIINPAGALLALTVTLPSSPANNDCVFIKFTQNVTTVTYSGGTVVDGITAPTAGGLIVLVYDSGTTSWY